jgi:hypothetical protein
MSWRFIVGRVGWGEGGKRFALPASWTSFVPLQSPSPLVPLPWQAKHTPAVPQLDTLHPLRKSLIHWCGPQGRVCFLTRVAVACTGLNPLGGLGRAACFLARVTWNRWVEKQADWRFRMEDTPVAEICRRAGFPAENCQRNIERAYQAPRFHANVSWAQLRKADPYWAQVRAGAGSSVLSPSTSVLHGAIGGRRFGTQLRIQRCPHRSHGRRERRRLIPRHPHAHALPGGEKTSAAPQHEQGKQQSCRPQARLTASTSVTTW